MFGWIEISLLFIGACLLIGGVTPRFRRYRSLLWAGGALILITALYPRQSNALGQYLFGQSAGAPRLPLELFGIAWWLLGAWLLNSLLDQILHRTIFRNANEPHARRLFADLASAFIYIVAFVGIMDTVFKQPLSGVLATSGVLAIVLGLALQNTLADVFSGLAINIERPFGAGDWITMAGTVEGQIIEINWRATRIKTASNDVIVIPNSVVAKAIVTNHRRLNDPYVCTIQIKISPVIPPARVLDVLQAAAASSPGISSGSKPQAYACSFSDALVTYGLSFAIDDFIQTAGVQSDVVSRVVEALRGQNIPIGAPVMDVRLIQRDIAAANDAAGDHMV